MNEIGSPQPLSSEHGTNKSLKARHWPWLEPFIRHTSLKPCILFPCCSASEGKYLAGEVSGTIPRLFRRVDRAHVAWRLGFGVEVMVQICFWGDLGLRVKSRGFRVPNSGPGMSGAHLVGRVDSPHYRGTSLVRNSQPPRITIVT